MKPEELCIGDWVRRRWTCTDTGREIVRDFQVTEIRKNGETLYAWGKGGNMGRVENLEPISLTPEILEKNGWEIPEYGLWYRHPATEICIALRTSGAYLYSDDEQDKRGFFCVIHSIHELQHFLKLVGIEKDIVL